MVRAPTVFIKPVTLPMPRAGPVRIGLTAGTTPSRLSSSGARPRGRPSAERGQYRRFRTQARRRQGLVDPVPDRAGQPRPHSTGCCCRCNSSSSDQADEARLRRAASATAGHPRPGPLRVAAEPLKGRGCASGAGRPTVLLPSRRTRSTGSRRQPSGMQRPRAGIVQRRRWLERSSLPAVRSAQAIGAPSRHRAALQTFVPHHERPRPLLGEARDSLAAFGRKHGQRGLWIVSVPDR